MKYYIIALLTFFTLNLSAQALNKYWVQFTDKKGTPYSIFKPQEFLSPRAIERRQRLGIVTDELDLPVTPQYIETVSSMGAKVYTVSKWFNAATIYVEDEAIIEKIKKLPFVKNIEATGRYRKARPIRKQKSRDYRNDYPQTNNYYGYGWNQISMLNGHKLHQIGYNGEGMLIAVLDGGFVNFDIAPFFDSLRTQHKIYESRDFVDNDRWAYEASNHGFNVISTIASNLPGLLVGTSPNASVICIRTEEVGSELRIEEDNWIAGAEYADSLGVDVINSSLGYTFFDKSDMNYSYEDMDGNTARITRGADIASRKGILVVNSAGNEGDGNWRYIGAPADADSVMTIGGVDRNRVKADFSSFGPTRDGRIKPSVSARAYQTVVATTTYQVDSANGTSFSSPVMAGMVTSLWQAFPHKTNMDIKNAVEQSGDLAANPNNALGYGIPDMMKAYRILSNTSTISLNTSTQKTIIIQEPFEEYFDIIWDGQKSKSVEVKVYNNLGQTIKSLLIPFANGEINRVRIDDVNQYPSGSYIISVRVGTSAFKFNLLKM